MKSFEILWAQNSTVLNSKEYSKDYFLRQGKGKKFHDSQTTKELQVLFSRTVGVIEKSSVQRSEVETFWKS